MTVYCIMELTDHEYGYRDLESIWSTYDGAFKHIEKLGQQRITLWNDQSFDLYTIEAYSVEE